MAQCSGATGSSRQPLWQLGVMSSISNGQSAVVAVWRSVTRGPCNTAALLTTAATRQYTAHAPRHGQTHAPQQCRQWLPASTFGLRSWRFGGLWLHCFGLRSWRSNLIYCLRQRLAFDGSHHWPAQPLCDRPAVGLFQTNLIVLMMF